MASCRPAPIAGPLIAPTTGIGRESMALCSAMSRRGIGGERVAGEVGAGVEHRALAGEHDGPDILGRRLLDRLTQTVDKLGVQRIAALRALQFQGCHVAVSGHTNHGATLSAR